jgi:hypothetical protein
MSTRNRGPRSNAGRPVKIALLLCCALSALRLPAQNDTPETTDSAARPQVISFNDNTKLTLLGVTRGKDHVAPNYENLGNRDRIHTPGHATVVWIEAAYSSKQRPSYELLVSDKTLTGCVPTEQRTSLHVRNGVGVQGFVLKAFPRWDKETVLRVRPYDGAIVSGQFVLTNAAPKLTADWTAESLPMTKSEGDLEVTLTNLSMGALLPYGRGRKVPENDPANYCVRLAFGLRQNGHPATNWHAWLVNTSDPAGNQVRGSISGYPLGGFYEAASPGQPYVPKVDGHFFYPGLWSDYSPWKIRIEFTRKSGFNEDEILTLTNLPVRAGTKQESDEQWSWDEDNTNFTFTSATVNGVQVKVLEPLRTPDDTNGGHLIRIIVYTDLPVPIEGMRLKVLEASDEQGRPLANQFQPGPAGRHFFFSFHRVPDIKRLNLKLALHKSRFVEFTATPTRL